MTPLLRVEAATGAEREALTHEDIARLRRFVSGEPEPEPPPEKAAKQAAKRIIAAALRARKTVEALLAPPTQKDPADD